MGTRQAGGFAMSAEALPELHSIFALIITCQPGSMDVRLGVLDSDANWLLIMLTSLYWVFTGR
jgi:hypothetical protein